MSEIKLFVATSTIVQEIPGKGANFKKDIQALFEKHLDTLLNIRFVCSEFLAGYGRIDTLGLDEKNSPVIIEYKRNMTSHGISRGLSYMDWLMDHRNDFYVKVLREIDRNMADCIDWSSPRLICVAEDFEKYDIRAANRMDNVELIKYKKYGDELVLLEFMSRSLGGHDNAKIDHLKTTEIPTKQRRVERSTSRKRPISYKTHEENLKGMRAQQSKRYRKLEIFLQSLGTDIMQVRNIHNEIFSRNKKRFASLQLVNQKNKIYLDLNLDPKRDGFGFEEGFIRDMTSIGHWGAGNLRVNIELDDEIEMAKPLIQKAYDKAYRP
ncbi:MAG: DUF91 domain-containing protein [Ectothiorhodospiraceae bacterium AqS1]|nr:DUF91 domain-containing protein [Ectothiorhodospiraceae bacterium AqS1]MBF2759629.1 DUF91 domain-containing protein [Ectothiorhodospiraceae bacterium AqS1]